MRSTKTLADGLVAANMLRLSYLLAVPVAFWRGDKRLAGPADPGIRAGTR
jgi:hypothetical protein